MSANLPMPVRSITIILVSMLTLAACTGLRPGFEMPTVTINGFRAVPSESASPEFLIGLHVVNPNREALNIEGIAYTVTLEGRQLLTGVGRDFPVIEGYGEGDITISAQADLLESIRLISDLMAGPRDTFKYELKAKLDMGAFRPPINVKDSGELSLQSVLRPSS